MIIPYNSNILFRPLPSESVSSGGIIVPDSYKRHSNKGEIMAVGEGSENRPMKLKKGMIGYRVKDWGFEFQEDGVTYFLMDENAIIAIE